MKKTFLAILATAAALFARSASAETVQIANAADWATFADRVNSGETTLDAEMTANVTLTQDSPRVGTDSNKYSGNFDGDGHTITLHWAVNGIQNLAPFAHVSGCTIHDLHIAGSIQTDQGYVAGFIGSVHGGALLERCRCSVSITVETGGDTAWHLGGFFVDTDTSIVNQEIILRDCLFDGAFQLPNVIYGAGFGHSYGNASYVRIYNSLFAPSNVTMPSVNYCWTFTGTDKGELSNIYRTQPLGNDQGTDASSMSAQDLAAALGENWTVSNGKVMLEVFDRPMELSDGEIYTVASSETLQGNDGKSAIAVADGASAVINIKSGATLTVTGGNASGTTGGAPAIRVPESSTLYIVGDGTLIATGGAAANGGDGGNGMPGEIDIPNARGRGGAGGAGGDGGGGGAPAIGGIGGAGTAASAAAGTAGDYTDWKSFDSDYFNFYGNIGRNGSGGANGGGMGKVVILGDLIVRATAGAAATSDGAGGSHGAVATDKGSGRTSDFTGGGGGGGGGGARGQNAEYGIGGGGAGGACGGGGGSGGTWKSSSYIAVWGAGGGGASSYCGTAGADGSCGKQSEDDVIGHMASSGGMGNTTRGGNGTFQTLNSVTMTVSPAREAAQPTAQTSGDAVAASITVTFMSDETTVGTEQATLMFAPPAAPGPVAKDGYLFIGYYTAATGGTQIYDAGCNPVYPVWQTVEDTTLYARWVQAYSLTFVSEGGTVGVGDYAEGGTASAPIPQRTGDYIFQGYYTGDSVQVFDASGALVSGSLSGLSPETTLYAQWAVPEGSEAKLVYRGQLNLLTGAPATNDTSYTKKMHFRVYDSSEATTPLWSVNDQVVTVNADGSFVHMFGDDDLSALIATGKVTHIGLAIGPSANLATELKPRRELRPVAAVNRALTAEGAALDIRIGNLVTENALVAADATVSHLEVAGTVNAYGGGKVSVSPLVVGAEEHTRLLRGGGVKVFARASPTELALMPSAQGAVSRGQEIAVAPSDGVALISCKAEGERALRCPAVIQYCKKDDKVRSPTYIEGGVKVTFFPFVGKEGR